MDNDTMVCIGRCDRNGDHEPDSPEEWRELLAEKDARIANLEADLRRVTERLAR
jgi:hypothetical protein